MRITSQFDGKRQVSILFLVCLLFISRSSIQAQNSYGIIAGGGKTMLKKIPGSIEDFNRFSSRTSFWGGITARFGLGEQGFSLFTSAVYNKKGYTYSQQNTTGMTNTLKDSAFNQDLNYADINIQL
ncbi:MAG TPA: hypothetical protein PLA61_12390, partial [Ferruginibacter sp.]|nr:hypothetical protein [Ferruginibacter sp.]